MPSPIEKPGTNRAFSLGLGRQAKHQNEGISMCYGTNCGREGAFGTCYHPEDCIMRAIERDAEERFVRDGTDGNGIFPMGWNGALRRRTSRKGKRESYGAALACFHAPSPGNFRL